MLLHKRLVASSVTLCTVLATVAAIRWTSHQMGDESTLTGWTLLVATAGLYLLTARKRLIQHRLGPVSFWLQMHVYMGSFASIIFFCILAGQSMGYSNRSSPPALRWWLAAESCLG